MKREDLRRSFSALLMHTSESHHKECHIMIGADLKGHNKCEMPIVTSVFQMECEGIIYFVIDGYEEPVEFDDMSTKDLRIVYEVLKGQ